VLENYLQIFVVLTLAILVFSVRLATTISARISSLPAAVEASGTAEWENKAKPCALLLNLSQRSDEIGRLSAALRGMVAALYGRIEANEKFAGEVAHEIKNPLASLRATVGAFAIAKSGPERQQLFNVIDHDVLRIDRRVNDISTASKLDNDLLKDQESEFELVPMISRLS
jgi:two-component system sensor histidine kinase ChvG